MKQITTLLFNPFEKYSETILLTFGITFTVLGTLLGFYFDARFDGVLDMHFVENATLKQVALDNLIAIFCLFVFLFGAAKFINSKTRFVDILNTILISRVAIYLLSFAPKPNDDFFESLVIKNVTQINDLDIFLVTVMSFIVFLGVVWHITLLYNGFKTASNAKKILPVILFVISIIMSEILSKVLIYYFN